MANKLDGISKLKESESKNIFGSEMRAFITILKNAKRN